MKKVLGLLVICLMVMGLTGPAAAISYTFVMGSESSISSTPALTDNTFITSIQMNSALSGTEFTLNSGESMTLHFATVFGNNFAFDLESRDITAKIDFGNPNQAVYVSGLAEADWAPSSGLDNCFNLTWDDPLKFYLGNNDYMTVDLLDINYTPVCDWPGTKVNLTVTYSRVPVPAAVWLLGSGLVGLAGLRRKFRN